jgi:hypothetical protein
MQSGSETTTVLLVDAVLAFIWMLFGTWEDRAVLFAVEDCRKLGDEEVAQDKLMLEFNLTKARHGMNNKASGQKARNPPPPK